MKQLHFTLSCSMLLFSAVALAQPCGQHLGGLCTDTIPAEANVISSSASIGPVVNECYWLCIGTELTITGVSSGNLNIDMEEGSILNFSGNESTIWAKSGCTINIVECSPIIRIKMEPDVTINDAFGGECTVIDTCDVEFDYSKAPAPGCFTAIEESDQADATLIYPNPAETGFYIQLSSFTGQPVELFISDVSGKIVFSDRLIVYPDGKIFVTLPGLAGGIYTVTDGEHVHELLVIR